MSKPNHMLYQHNNMHLHRKEKYSNTHFLLSILGLLAFIMLAMMFVLYEFLRVSGLLDLIKIH